MELFGFANQLEEMIEGLCLRCAKEDSDDLERPCLVAHATEAQIDLAASEEGLDAE